MCVDVLDDDDYDDDEDYDEEREEHESEFFSLAKKAKITQESIDAAINKLGSISFLDYNDHTPLIVLLEKASENHDSWSIRVAQAPENITGQVQLLLANRSNLDQVCEEGLTALLAALTAGISRLRIFAPWPPSA